MIEHVQEEHEVPWHKKAALEYGGSKGRILQHDEWHDAPFGYDGDTVVSNPSNPKYKVRFGTQNGFQHYVRIYVRPTRSELNLIKRAKNFRRWGNVSVRSGGWVELPALFTPASDEVYSNFKSIFDLAKPHRYTSPEKLKTWKNKRTIIKNVWSGLYETNPEISRFMDKHLPFAEKMEELLRKHVSSISISAGNKLGVRKIIAASHAAAEDRVVNSAKRILDK